MSCRRLPQYCSDCGWISGIALVRTLASIRPALRGFTRIRCCSLSPASFPRALTGTSLLQQEFLIHCSGDIGEQARPKHLGFLCNLYLRESEIVGALSGSTKPIR